MSKEGSGTLPPSSEATMAAADMLEVLGKPHALKEVQAVWFLADHGPKIRIQFGAQEETYQFFYDSERQRFRHKFATTLMKKGDEKPVKPGKDSGEKAEKGKEW